MAAASQDAAARPRQTTPARVGMDAPGGIGAVPQSTAKAANREKKVPQSTAKTDTPPRFVVLDESDDEGDFDDFAGLDAKEWRVETRYRWRKDGKEIIYWNYRRRKIHHDADGNRRIEYRKGGSRER